MNLALNYCWKEWRAQRGLLVSYTLLVFGCLGLVLYLSPRHFWFDETFGVHALSWFVAASVIGVVGFVVPGLVRSEYTGKGEQFVRRLPGALWPSLWGKLLFLLLATLLLPLLGLLVGEVFVTSLGESWVGLFTWQWDGLVRLVVPQLAYYCAGALLLVPWVWAAATWTPGGRLSLLATVLLVLLIGIGVFAVERQSPHILDVRMLLPWCWAVPTTGLIVAGLSWAVGRRGGGAMRSARVGLTATMVMLLPFAGWLGNRVMHYHFPDCSALQSVRVNGMTADGRYMLAHVSENENWYGVAVRIDLQTGAVEQVGGVGMAWMPGAARPYALQQQARGRFWRVYGGDDNDLRVFDLQTGRWRGVDYDTKSRRLNLTPELRTEVLEDRMSTTAFADADGRPVCMLGGRVYRRGKDGIEGFGDWVLDRARAIRAAGLGIATLGGNEVFDIRAARPIRISRPRNERQLLVGSSRMFVRSGDGGRWMIERDGELPVPCYELEGLTVLGLLDAYRVLAYRRDCRLGRRLAVFTPDDGTVVDVEVPADLSLSSVEAVAPMRQDGSMLGRDPDGCVWLICRGREHGEFVRMDPATLRLSVVLRHGFDRFGRGMQLLSWDDWPELVVAADDRVQRVHAVTGERTTLFPRN